MIRRITGTIVDCTETNTVVDVNGVGYFVYTPNAPQHKLESTVIFFTHLAVRETALDLYGFTTRDELELFELLLSLPKIGPKSALQIMTQADIELLKTAVLSDDPAHLSKMSGIGKKTAEKIVIGLKDKFEQYAGAYTSSTPSENGAVHSSDAIDALITLGYPQNDARKVVQQLQAEKPTLINANDVVKEALKMLG